MVSRLPDDTFPLDMISAKLNRVCASVHKNEPVSSTHAVSPGRGWSSDYRNGFFRSVRPHHRWGQSRPTYAAESTRDQCRAVSSAQWDTSEEVIDTEDEDTEGSGDTIDPTCKNACETRSSLHGQWRERCPDSRRARFSAGNGMSKTCGTA